MRTTSRVTTDNGINWYYEQEGSGLDIVLIPGGLGDCGMYSKAMTEIASGGFRVTSFDMPGMSRSQDAPSETYSNVTAQKLASYVVNLLDHLEIKTATFFGSSSGAATVLVLCKDYPARVASAMVHEAPASLMDILTKLEGQDDETIIKTLDGTYRSAIGSFATLGPLEVQVYERCLKNSPRWLRGYTRSIPPSTPIDQLDKVARKPTSWTVGAESPMGLFFDNVVGAVRAGIEIELLPGGHFVFFSHPGVFAKYVLQKAQKVKGQTADNA